MMKKRSSGLLVAVLAVFTAAAGAAEEEGYDFYGLVRYPEGGRRRPWVELYEVVADGGPADRYQRREVDWWPRKGVDVFPVKDGMPLRTWTLRYGPFDEIDRHVGVVARRETAREFQAHLIGFRGLGVPEGRSAAPAPTIRCRPPGPPQLSYSCASPYPER